MSLRDFTIHAPRSLAIATFVTVAIATSSCADTNPSAVGTESSTPTSPTARPSFPFPPILYNWDMATPLSEQQRAAAEIAIRTRISINEWLIEQNPTTPPEILAAVSFENRHQWISIVPLPETGGVLDRAVEVTEVSPTRWIVTACRYDTPGVYSMGTDNQLSLSSPGENYVALISTVESTKGPDGSGKRSDSPRLLVVDSEQIFDENARQTCTPFRPEPYVQEPPQPLPAGK